MSRRPNVVYVFADQWRAQALGYAGDPNVRTPHLDRFAGEALNVSQAIAGIPVCGPSRACLMTGQWPLTHGVFLNDAPLDPGAESIGKSFARGGYATGYIGKWHIDGHGRSAYIPPERRQGFAHWQVLECTHDYNHSLFYDQDDSKPGVWPGYDADAQTESACRFIREKADGTRPFFLMLSWGPPHDPFQTAPDPFRRLYDPEKLVLRPNVTPEMEAEARRDLAGYYAHCTALDEAFGRLVHTLDEAGIAENTILIFTSDHGEMLGSHGQRRKQRPWEESLRIPFLARYPERWGRTARQIPVMLDMPDVMPTLLSLCGLEIPSTVEGRDFSAALDGGADPSNGEGLLQCIHPFGEFTAKKGGREYRGVRTLRHTYVEDRSGVWLLYDNASDPYQMTNLANDPAHAVLREKLAGRLKRLLQRRGDRFEAGMAYVERWGYTVDANGTIAYRL